MTYDETSEDQFLRTRWICPDEVPWYFLIATGNSWRHIVIWPTLPVFILVPSIPHNAHRDILIVNVINRCTPYNIFKNPTAIKKILVLSSAAVSFIQETATTTSPVHYHHHHHHHQSSWSRTELRKRRRRSLVQRERERERDYE